MKETQNTQRPPLSRRAFLEQASVATAGLLITGCRGTKAPQDDPPAPTTTPEATPTTAPATETPRPTATHAPETAAPFTPTNAPIGTARGRHPGRVTWAHNPDVARWDGSTGRWWQPEHLNAGGVSEMLSQALRAQMGEDDDAAAWDALFRHFNQGRGRGHRGYEPGETIAVKLNLNVVSQGHAYTGNGAFSSPQLVAALARQLVGAAGVTPGAVTVYDATRYVPDAIIDACRAPELDGLRFVDWAGGEGRERYRRDPSSQIRWSGDVEGNPTYLPACVTGADYLINLAALRGHNLAGVTLCGKNHFGTICADLEGQPTQQAPQGASIHGTVAAHDFTWRQPDWAWQQRPMGTYNAIVDLMAHPDLGAKTLLFLLDGFYVAQDQNSDVTGACRWQSPPFDGHWTASLLLSQDGVALDSVGLDLVRSEPTINRRDDVMPPHSTCDNYLHEAAQADAPPSGTVYDPVGAGQPPESLGVHEHWNDAADKAYTRNLGAGDGIELVRIV